MTANFAKVGVIGAGAWGTALAQVCARAGAKVMLFAREPEVVASIEATRENSLFLPGIELDPSVQATGTVEALATSDLILNVTPSQYLRASLVEFAPCWRSDTPIVLCAKGIEQSSLKLMTTVLAETLPNAPAAVLSGPSFAAEVARGMPTAVTLACPNRELGQRIIQSLATSSFRPYLVADMIGAEVGGSVKNVLAIACGIVEGRGLGRSAHAALITRGFAELTRLAVAFGGEAETVAGLCGLGDLVLTCSSSQSRNMSVGLALGRGESLVQALAGKSSVAEGVASAPAVAQLALKLGIDMPICVAVADILAGREGVDAAIASLLSRPLRSEH